MTLRFQLIVLHTRCLMKDDLNSNHQSQQLSNLTIQLRAQISEFRSHSLSFITCLFTHCDKLMHFKKKYVRMFGRNLILRKVISDIVPRIKLTLKPTNFNDYSLYCCSRTCYQHGNHAMAKKGFHSADLILPF